MTSSAAIFNFYQNFTMFLKYHHLGIPDENFIQFGRDI